VPDLGLTLARSYAAATKTPTLGTHVGEVLTWDSTTSTNTIRVAGVVMNNLPVLTSAGSVSLSPGSVVELLRVRTQYFVLGRVVDQSTGLINPQFPIRLYPQFKALRAVGTVGYWNVANGTLAAWEGRIKVSFPYVEIDGTWGPDTGGSTTTYQLQLGGNVVGEWTETAVVSVRRGPFDIRAFMGQDWLKIEVKMTSSTGGGNAALQVIGCYFRDSI
jgi:hypothetical protein